MFVMIFLCFSVGRQNYIFDSVHLKASFCDVRFFCRKNENYSLISSETRCKWSIHMHPSNSWNRFLYIRLRFYLADEGRQLYDERVNEWMGPWTACMYDIAFLIPRSHPHPRRCTVFVSVQLNIRLAPTHWSNAFNAGHFRLGFLKKCLSVSCISEGAQSHE